MKIKFSIKTKLLLLTTLIVVLPVLYIVYSTIKLESKDKLNNAYQSQLIEAKFASEKLLGLIKPTLNSLRSIASLNIQNYTKENYSNEVLNVFKNQNEIKNLYISEVPLIKNEKIEIKYRNDLNVNNDILVKNLLVENYRIFLDKEEVIVDNIEINSSKFLTISIIDYNYDKYQTKILVYTAILDINPIKKELSYKLDVFNKRGKNIFTTDSFILENQEIFKKMSDKKIKSKTFEYEYLNKQFLGSSSNIGYGITLLISQPLVKVKGYLYQWIQSIVLIGLLSIVFAIIITVIISSKYIINPITELVLATSKVAHGDFNINIEKKSNDEVGVLANSFNNMSNEIQNLLSHKIEKVKMENEINIAATVQKTLFPEKLINEDKFDISSFYVPASACGGDLWNYFYLNNKLYIMISDATGHGLPSALITVSAKSVFSLIKQMLINDKINNISSKELLKLANSVIYETSNGSINMTMFIGIIDLESMKMEYTNAGHNPPWLIKKDKFISLSGDGHRLGEKENIDMNLFETKNIEINHNDHVFLYTDGIIEGSYFKNKAELFGKKRLKEILLANINNKPLFNIIKNFIAFTNKKNEYEDDITLVLVKIKDEFNE